MDKIWLDNGHDFRMMPYRVIATNDQVGMIEVVKDSKTLSTIQQQLGGWLFCKKNIWSYLKDLNPDPNSFEIAKDNFLRSCAGYCVSVYILGKKNQMIYIGNFYYYY